MLSLICAECGNNLEYRLEDPLLITVEPCTECFDNIMEGEDV
jgi:hypothetical protein